MIKRTTKKVVMGLLLACMLSGSMPVHAAAAENHVHTWVISGNPNVNSWSYTHSSNVDGGHCLVNCWVSSEFEQCKECGKKKWEIFTEHGRHSSCSDANYDKRV